MPDATHILEVENLTVAFEQGRERREVVSGVSFSLQRGRTLGIVGESGSGKSVSSLSVMGLLPPTAKIVSGHAWFRPNAGDKPADLLTLDDKQMQTLRGRRIAMIFQEPMTSLNPVKRCGHQVMEMLERHTNTSRAEARSLALQLFEEVRLPRPEKIFSSYPHEISGGQKQRVMIAMALICKPDIIIADEPTTALDVTVQQSILNLLRSLQQKYGMAILFISHDLGVVAQVADDVVVMQRGKLVEQGPASQILRAPNHPYTKHLLACRPETFEPFRTEIDEAADSALLVVRNLKVDYPLRKNLLGRPTELLHAVDGVTFDVRRGETLGIVGESGCGKSTLGRAILRLVDSRSDQLTFCGKNLATISASDMRRLRQKLQIVFQDPYSSLNPRIKVGDAIAEPLLTHTKCSSSEARLEVEEILQRVGLEPTMADRYPHQLSGGQRQRVCIARALIVKPELVICDESVSALDVSVQAQVLQLLCDLKQQYGYTYMFISHNLAVVNFMADRLLVMRQGHVEEYGPTDSIFANPQSDYTRQLLEAVPKIS
ncbi:MAG: ABC transporter ATP-binding protein [Bacteroidales bacterium]|nr:ABC transporter ATP-binding protein [Bacteroidales bacterium]